MPGEWDGMWTRPPLAGEPQAAPPRRTRGSETDSYSDADSDSDSGSDADPLLPYTELGLEARQEAELNALTIHWEYLGFHGLPNGEAEDDRVREVAEARVRERRPGAGADIPALNAREASRLNDARSIAVAQGRGQAQAGRRLAELLANESARPLSPSVSSDSDTESFDFDNFSAPTPDGPLEGVRELRQAAYGRTSPARGGAEDTTSADSYAVRPPPRNQPPPPRPHHLPPLPPPPDWVPPPPPGWVPPPPPPPPVTPPPPPRSPHGRGDGRGQNPGQGPRPGQRRGHGSR